MGNKPLRKPLADSIGGEGFDGNLGDDEKINYGAAPDFSVRYNTNTDSLEYYDEENEQRVLYLDKNQDVNIESDINFNSKILKITTNSDQNVAGIAIDGSLNPNSSGGVVIGRNSYSTCSSGVAFGPESRADACGATALGSGAEANNSDTTVIGNSATASSNHATVLGAFASDNGAETVTIGGNRQEPIYFGNTKHFEGTYNDTTYNDVWLRTPPFSVTTGSTEQNTGNIMVDTSGGAVTATINAQMAIQGHELRFKRDGANTATIESGGGETIEGNTSIDLTTDGEAVTLVFDGTEYKVVGHYDGTTF